MMLRFTNTKDYSIGAKIAPIALNVSSEYAMRLVEKLSQTLFINANICLSGLRYLVEACDAVGRDAYVYQEQMEKLIGAS